MRQITKESAEAFLSGTPFKKANTEVKILALENNKPCWIALYLFGNKIAERHTNKRTNSLKISNCGYKTATTKERLNGLPNVDIKQKSGNWFLNGKAWNGELINIK